MFQENLQRALQHVPGTRAAMLIGFDGIPIASLYAEGHSEESTQLLNYAIEVSHMLGKINKTALDREMPPITSITVNNAAQRILAHVVQEEYLLMLALEPGADWSRGDQMLKLLAPWVDKEMSV